MLVILTVNQEKNVSYYIKENYIVFQKKYSVTILLNSTIFSFYLVLKKSIVSKLG